MASEGIELEVYDGRNPDELITVLAFRGSPKYLDEIEDVGGGNFTIRRDDQVFADYPNLLTERNYVRVKVNGETRGGFILFDKDRTEISASEYQDLEISLSGEGPLAWLESAIVLPEGGLRRKMLSSNRSFNFATKVGSWYKSSEWGGAFTVARQGDTNKNSNPWVYAPAEWPDAPNAKWIWSGDSINGAPVGKKYFRYNLNVPSSGKYQIFSAADDYYTIYVDGQVAIESPLTSESWTATDSVEIDLDAGNHVIAAEVENIGGPAALLMAIFRFGNAETNTAAQLVAQTGSTGWLVYKGSSVPGWTAGEVIMQLFEEAEERGVEFPTFMNFGFTATHDSYGNPWTRADRYSFPIGTFNYLRAIQAMRDMGYEFWVDPDTLTLHAAPSRGVDRSVEGAANGVVPIVFQEGRDIEEAEDTIRGDIQNTMYVQSDDGWEIVTSNDSISKFGVVETGFSANKTAAEARELAKHNLTLKAFPQESASVRVMPTEGQIPFKDYQVGDWVTVRTEFGDRRRRVVSISIEEGPSGEAEYALEFDSVFQEHERRTDKILENISNGNSNASISSSGGVADIRQHFSGGRFIRVPMPPYDVRVESIGDWTLTGEAVSTVYVQWEPPALNVDGSTASILGYEIWVRPEDDTTFRRATMVDTTQASLSGYLPHTRHYFKVRAVGTGDGRTSEWSEVVEHFMKAPEDPLGTPTAPVLSSSLETVTVEWDGNLLDDEGEPYAAPSHLRDMKAFISYDGVTFEPSGTTLTSGGIIVLTGAPVGETVYVKLQGYDRQMEPSAFSDTVSIVVEGIEFDVDVDEELQEIRDEMQGLIDGVIGEVAIVSDKFTITTVNPTPADGVGKETGSIWEVRSGGTVNRRYMWNGSQWVQIKIGQDFVGENAIGDAQIANLSAGKITTGFLSGDRIAAGTILSTMIAADQIIADHIASNQIETQHIKADAITANKIDAGAISAVHISGNTLVGTTVTGGVFQTSESANTGIKINSSGFKLYNTSNQLIADLSPSGLSIVGGVTTNLVGLTGSTTGAVSMGAGNVRTYGTLASPTTRSGIEFLDSGYGSHDVNYAFGKIFSAGNAVVIESPLGTFGPNPATDVSTRRGVIKASSTGTEMITVSNYKQSYTQTQLGAVSTSEYGVNLRYSPSGSGIGNSFNLNSTGITFMTGTVTRLTIQNTNDHFTLGQRTGTSTYIRGYHQPGWGNRIVIDALYTGANGHIEFYGSSYQWYGTKNFAMDHPTRPDKALVHAAVESPSSGIMYWNEHVPGSGLLDDQGEQEVELPDYVDLIGAELKAFATCEGAPYTIGVSQVEGGKFTVYGEPGRRFNWIVLGSRKDYYFNVVREKVPEREEEEEQDNGD